MRATGAAILFGGSGEGHGNCFDNTWILHLGPNDARGLATVRSPGSGCPAGELHTAAAVRERNDPGRHVCTTKLLKTIMRATYTDRTISTWVRVRRVTAEGPPAARFDHLSAMDDEGDRTSSAALTQRASFCATCGCCALRSCTRPHRYRRGRRSSRRGCGSLAAGGRRARRLPAMTAHHPRLQQRQRRRF